MILVVRHKNLQGQSSRGTALLIKSSLLQQRQSNRVYRRRQLGAGAPLLKGDNRNYRAFSALLGSIDPCSWGDEYTTTPHTYTHTKGRHTAARTGLAPNSSNKAQHCKRHRRLYLRKKGFARKCCSDGVVKLLHEKNISYSYELEQRRAIEVLL